MYIMRAIVNNTPTTRWGQDEFHVKGICNYPNEKGHKEVIETLWKSFNSILVSISLSVNEVGLKTNIDYSFDIDEEIAKYFKYGFGSNHMWVKQIDDKGNCQGDNIIFVEFK